MLGPVQRGSDVFQLAEVADIHYVLNGEGIGGRESSRQIRSGCNVRTRSVFTIEGDFALVGRRLIQRPGLVVQRLDDVTLFVEVPVTDSPDLTKIGSCVD